MNRNQSGQSTMEYLVVCSIIFILLAMGDGEDGSVITLFLESIRTGFDRFSSFISIPI